MAAAARRERSWFLDVQSGGGQTASRMVEFLVRAVAHTRRTPTRSLSCAALPLSNARCGAGLCYERGAQLAAVAARPAYADAATAWTAVADPHLNEDRAAFALRDALSSFRAGPGQNMSWAEAAAFHALGAFP